MSAECLFAQYKHIMPCPENFLAATSSPLPTTIWVNTLKISPTALRASLENDGVRVYPLAWTEQGFRVESNQSMGVRWQFDAGYYQIQEEVSMLPVLALAPKPDEKILDMCAAPGSKTAQIAIAMQRSGTLIANDRNYQRMRTLGQIVQRLGLINCHLTIYDATHLPRLDNYFDKVLVDAPCSCEGTFRKSPDKVIKPDHRHATFLADKQLDLLRKAFKVCKTGGRIVYSTCTFSPIENEKVVNRFLLAYPGKIKLIDIDIPGFTLTSGLISDGEETFVENISKTKRVWPHLNNTGGFFLALFEKVAAYASSLQTESFESYDSKNIKPFLQQQCERFGIAFDYFSQFLFSTHSNRGVVIVAADTALPDKLHYDSKGLLFIKTRLKHPKLSTAAISWLYPQMTKHIIDLNAQQLEPYLAGKTLSLAADQSTLCDSTGYVAVTCQGRMLPQGVYLSDQNGQGERLKKF